MSRLTVRLHLAAVFDRMSAEIGEDGSGRVTVTKDGGEANLAIRCLTSLPGLVATVAGWDLRPTVA